MKTKNSFTFMHNFRRSVTLTKDPDHHDSVHNSSTDESVQYPSLNSSSSSSGVQDLYITDKCTREQYHEGTLRFILNKENMYQSHD